MQLAFELTPKQESKLHMTPELKNAIQILQYSRAELVDYLNEQLEENPLLEIADFSHSSKDGTYSGGEVPVEQWTDHPPSLAEQLMPQLVDFSLTPEQKEICLFMLHSLDDRGYLDIEPEILVNQLGMTDADWQRCLSVLHRLEPAGIGARSLAECLIIQLRRLKAPTLSITLAEQYLESIAQEQWEWISMEVQVDESEVHEAVSWIRACNPQPAAELKNGPTLYITPDIYVEQTKSGLSIRDGDDDFPRLSIRQDLQTLIAQDVESQIALQKWIQPARMLLKSLAQRKQTIRRVAFAIIQHQEAFFLQKESNLKPLTQRQIADELAIHESTVSRAIREKYMQTPQGLVAFRSFFSAGIPHRSGSEQSVHQVKQQLEQLIKQEDHQFPLSDQQLTKQLQHQGIIIARRTVSKYRQELGFPSARSRKSDSNLILPSHQMCKKKILGT